MFLKPKESVFVDILSLLLLVTETAPNDASSQVSQESATTNAGDAQNPVEKVSSKARRSKARKKVKQEKPQQAPCSPCNQTCLFFHLFLILCLFLFS